MTNTVFDILLKVSELEMDIETAEKKISAIQKKELKRFLEWYNDDTDGSVGSTLYDKAIKEYENTKI